MSPRNFPAGRAVLGGGLLAPPPPTEGQPAVGLLIAHCFSGKGFSKTSFPGELLLLFVILCGNFLALGQS